METSKNGKSSENSGSGNEKFSCRICFEIASEPVITPCGHLFWFL